MRHIFKHAFFRNDTTSAQPDSSTPPPSTGVADPEFTYNLCLNLKLSSKNRVTNMTAT